MSDTHQTEAEGKTEQFQDDYTPEELTKAKSLGYKDPKEWKGDPPKNGFKPVREFLEYSNNVLPIVQSENAKLKRELADARKEASDKAAQTTAKLENMERMSKAALGQLRRQLEAKYEAVKEAAVEVGDKVAYRQADKDAKAALKEFDEEAADKAPAEGEKLKDKPVNHVPEIDDWIAENRSWFNKDDDATAFAIRIQAKMNRDGVELNKSLADTLKQVKKRFPEFFEEEPADKDDADDDDKSARRGSPVEGGGSRMGGGGQRSAWSRLPADAQKQCDRFIKEDKLFLLKGETVEKDLQKARDRYAKQYHGEEA